MTIFPADIPNLIQYLYSKNTINYIIPMFAAETAKFIFLVSTELRHHRTRGANEILLNTIKHH